MNDATPPAPTRRTLLASMALMAGESALPACLIATWLSFAGGASFESL